MELYRQTATCYGASVLQSIMVDFWPECPVLTQLRTALVSGQKGKTVAALRWQQMTDKSRFFQSFPIFITFGQKKANQNDR
ncbi:hypothetical protein [Anaerobiospirillum sp. NML120511]|uniref:hypothetical protein n=1 Tax=Anaerobiospirillum sp. NML120511 TaxID=2932819 RepID=UPI001FF6C4A5|nr:hypothetical protein [Anaerobiospirillum sp. NML120511]MCK0533956.1 hypothetical protein [Anaerobiospirillum sp. NML120511]